MKKNNVLLKTINHLAFTLAEVLITLGIVGVIAQMTIPALVANINNQIYLNSFLNDYAILQEAARQVINDNSGDIQKVYSSDTLLLNALSAKLKVLKTCPDYNGCWTSPIFTLNKKNTQSTNDTTIVLANGAVLQGGPSYFDTNCAQSGMYSSNGNKGVCEVYWLDTNGAKSPNVLGRDIFILFLTNLSGFVPDGLPGTNAYDASWSYCDSTSSSTDNWMGAACGGRVFVERAINY